MHGKRLPGPATKAAAVTPAPRRALRLLEDTLTKGSPPLGRTLRQLTLSVLAVLCNRSRKEIAARSRVDFRQTSKFLTAKRVKELEDEIYRQLLEGIRPFREAAEPIATACVEAFLSLEEESRLTPEERAAVELEILAVSRRLRERLVQAVEISRRCPPEGYPAPADLAPARRLAKTSFARLKAEPEEARAAIVRASEACQTWAFCERVCAASEAAASQDLEAAAAWARLAEEIAERVRGPEGFRARLQGYAAAYGANVLRVQGELNAADAAFAEAERQWDAGADPAAVLDPGRYLGLKASLRRAQRRPQEALDLLEKALAVGRCRERVLIKKGATLEVMGEYERATETLLEALPLAERAGDPRLLYLARFNLAVMHTHLGRHDAAAALLPPVRELAGELGDAIFLIRVTWLEGRIFAGQGRPREARRLLAAARWEFQRRGMSYDVALALLEEASLYER